MTDAPVVGDAEMHDQHTGFDAPVVDAPVANKSLMGTSWNKVGSEEYRGPGDVGVTSDTQDIRNAFSDAYRATAPESITRVGQRSMFTPEAQRSIAGTWLGPAVNAVGDLVGTGVAGVAGVGNSALTLGNAALKSLGLPDNLIRDINLEGLRRSGEVSGHPTSANTFDRMRETEPPPVTPKPLPEVWREQRAAIPPDPVTQAINTLLRTSTSGTGMPTPPTPYGPRPLSLPAAEGLLGIPDRTRPGYRANVDPTKPFTYNPPSSGWPAGTETWAEGASRIIDAPEMLDRTKGYYSPADRQAAQGAMIHPDATDGMLKPLTDQVISDDPHKAIAVGNTPLVQLGTDYAALQGQPMSFDAAMSLDQRLTAERQAAMRGNPALAEKIRGVQDQIRDKMESLGDSDVTGDPTVLANLPNARKGWSQYLKRVRVDDIMDDASHLPDEKQNAYVRTRLTALARNDSAMRSWSPEEQAGLAETIKSGNIGAVRNFGISLIKPFAQLTGGAVGGTMFGPGGAYVGTKMAEGGAEAMQAKIRAALSKVTLDPVYRALSEGVPPPPPGR